MKETKTFFLIFSMILITLAGVSSLFAQDADTLRIPGPAADLTTAILSDTLADGSRTNLDRVYLLDRDGVYFITATVKNIGYALRIIGAEGEGKPPVIKSAPTSGSISRMFTPKADFMIKNLYLSNVDINDVEAAVFIEPQQDSLRIEAYNCIYDYGSWTDYKNETNHSTYIFDNCIFKNKYKENNFSNGKAFDNRGGHLTDSLVFVNCTFLNLEGNLISDWQQNLKYFKFVHNTVANEIKFPIAYQRIEEAYITDNIFHNSALFGGNQLPGGSTVETIIDSSVTPRDTSYMYAGMLQIDSLNGGLDNSNRILKWERNSVTYSQAIRDFWDTSEDYVPAILFNDSTLAWFDRIPGMSFMDTLSIMPEFTNLLNTDDKYIEFLKQFADAKARGLTPDWTNTDFRWYSTLGDTPWPLDEDLSYPTTSELYTAGRIVVDGIEYEAPLGSLQWFPAFTPTVVGVDGVASVPTSFTLEQNYPNPFNPTTTIKFSIPQATNVKLKVFNVIGQEVAELVNTQKAAGSYSIKFDGSNLASGMFIYRLEAGDLVQTRKLLLLK